MGFLDKGFLDKAKAAANDLASKADTALAGAGLGGPGSANSSEVETYLRDLGVVAFLEATGREVPASERVRLVTALNELESRGAVHALALRTAPPPAPGAAGAGPTAWGAPPAPGAAPPAPGTAAPPAPGTSVPPPAGPVAPPQAAPPPERPTAPPPPSWASGGNG